MQLQPQKNIKAQMNLDQPVAVRKRRWREVVGTYLSALRGASARYWLSCMFFSLLWILPVAPFIAVFFATALGVPVFGIFAPVLILWWICGNWPLTFFTVFLFSLPMILYQGFCIVTGTASFGWSMNLQMYNGVWHVLVLAFFFGTNKMLRCQANGGDGFRATVFERISRGVLISVYVLGGLFFWGGAGFLQRYVGGAYANGLIVLLSALPFWLIARAVLDAIRNRRVPVKQSRHIFFDRTVHSDSAKNIHGGPRNL